MTTPSSPITARLAGHVNQHAATGHPDPDPFWLPTLTFAQGEGLVTQRVNQSGDVISFVSVDTSNPRDFTSTGQKLTQSRGQPRLLGVVPDPHKPDELLYLDWLSMAKFCLGNFDRLRPRLEKNPVSAFGLAGFINGELPQYLKYSGKETRLNLWDYDLEMAELGAIAARHFRTSPALQQLSRDANFPPGMTP